MSKVLELTLCMATTAAVIAIGYTFGIGTGALIEENERLRKELDLLKQEEK